ncbi:MAG: type II toxin-antitoxin system VapC family toxin [Spirochaetales bacterium]|jgi:predicted nucleic acid-binding protein|nr:type II toxin-antitoxin system VapC family toxin [Spirochaetales bacterium]
MNTKIYLDTSIPSAYFGYTKPLRQLITQKWFENEANSYEIYISTLTIQEINKYKNEEKKDNILSLVLEHTFRILDLDKEISDLADQYIDKGAIPGTEREDAMHIASAAVNNIESLASWNFKHIVSINPIRKIHQINAENKYGVVEIGSLELFGGHKYGNL